MKIVGALRIKNEERWIVETLDALRPLCERIFVFDDHSTDHTHQILVTLRDARCWPITIVKSQSDGRLDETADKNYLYDSILNHPDYVQDLNGFHWPDWIAMIDGDEVLVQEDIPRLKEIMSDQSVVAIKARIMYLWNDREHVRIDGVYANFARPSFFRVINPSFRFQSTPNGGNMHCSSIPQELLGHATNSPVRLNHLGYMLKEDRLRKYAWYNSVDPNNTVEDYYRHTVQGDVAEVPADAQLKWAGPLRVMPL